MFRPKVTKGEFLYLNVFYSHTATIIGTLRKVYEMRRIGVREQRCKWVISRWLRKC